MRWIFLLFLSLSLPVLGQDQPVLDGKPLTTTAQAEPWNDGIESLIPNSASPQSEIRDPKSDIEGPRTMMSTGASMGSRGDSMFGGLIGYRATNNLTVFSMTRGGTLMAPTGAGDFQKIGLSPLSTFGLMVDGNKVGGWDNSFSMSFTPSLNMGANAAGPSSGAGQAPNLSWGQDHGYAFGTTFSKSWGHDFSTTFSMQMNHGDGYLPQSSLFQSFGSSFPPAWPNR